jgi:lysophospholipase L1-like esterase
MKHWHRRTFVAAGLVGAMLAVAAVLPTSAQQGASDHWVGTWATAVVSSQQRGFGGGRATTPPPGRSGAPARPAPFTVNNQTLREIVHVTLGGSRLRVVFTNAFGTDPVTIGAASVALHGSGPAIDPVTSTPLTFAGRRETTIPAGAVMFSDPAELTVPAFGDVAVDVYVPEDTSDGPLTLHGSAFQTSYLSEAGNHAGEAALPVARTTSSWYFLSRVEVLAPSNAGAVVTFGDSITDGTRSTPDTNHRWPDVFARRLAARGGARPMAVLNLGIAGNQILHDGAGVAALTRFDRDVVAQTGATHVIVLEAINDIGLARENAEPTAADLIAGHQQLIARAHARGLRIFGATLTPFMGAAYSTEVGEAKRQAVNQWIRTSGAYDRVIDFEAVVRDDSTPPRIMPSFDPGDHLHFTDAGYQKMAEVVPLDWFD